MREGNSGVGSSARWKKNNFLFFLLVAVLSSSRRSVSSHARLSRKGLEVVQGAVANLGEGPAVPGSPLVF